MYAARELSQAVRTRRTEIGLSQTALAKMAGLSLSTIVQIENATIKDLSLSRTAAVLNAIGLELIIWPAHPRLDAHAAELKPPLEIAARLARGSLRRALSPVEVSVALVTAIVPAGFKAHFGTLLSEAPLPLLALAVEQIHAETGATRDRIWANMRSMAIQLKSTRDFWCAEM